jgi:hypothetical protein
MYQRKGQTCKLESGKRSFTNRSSLYRKRCADGFVLDVDAALGLEDADAGAVVGCGSSEGDRRSLSTESNANITVKRNISSNKDRKDRMGIGTNLWQLYRPTSPVAYHSYWSTGTTPYR